MSLQRRHCNHLTIRLPQSHCLMVELKEQKLIAGSDNGEKIETKNRGNQITTTFVACPLA